MSAPGSAEGRLRSAIIVGSLLSAENANRLPLDAILHQVEQARVNPAGVRAGGGFRPIEEAFTEWNALGPRLRRTSAALVVFEAWNLFVILNSLGGFAHVPALMGVSWTSWALWLIAIITVVVTGISVFVWLERG